ncbi:MAG: hypothetical protein VXW32_13395, partial [Myxococcota bacterium]|nr:hypothetical protein [Myxococcota bacterium]
MYLFFALGIGLLGAIIQLVDAPWWVTVGTGIPCVTLLPGWGLARRIWPRSSWVQSLVDSAWVGILIAGMGVALMRLTGFGSWLLWAVGAAAIGFSGLRRSLVHSPPRPSSKVVFGLFVLGTTVSTLAVSYSPTLSRGLDVGWYHADLQERLGEQVSLRPAAGWESHNWVSSSEMGALALVDDEASGGMLEIQAAGPVGFLVRGPLGTRIAIRQGDTLHQSPPVTADVQELEEEGPVPRYLEHGMAGVLVEVSPGPLEVSVSSSSRAHALYVLPGQEAIWALDRSGQAKNLHYYQLLNKVENQRWALETLE